MHNHQKGVSLIITFFVITILLATVLALSTIVSHEINMISNAGNAVSSFYAAQSGLEKTLYFNRKQIPPGGTTGLCNLCNACSGSDCTSCTVTPLAAGGCNLTTCSNCEVTYNSTFDGRTLTINDKVSPDPLNSSISIFVIGAKGLYRNTTRTLAYGTSVQNIAPNPVPTITTISPGLKAINSAGFTLTVNGTNFIASSVVNFNGSPRATTYISSVQVTASILASDLVTPGSYPITVTNPTPGGGTSNAKSFVVNPYKTQTVFATSTGSAANITWNTPTTSGNILIAVVASSSTTGNANQNAPSGWTQAVTSNNSRNRVTIFYRQNAPSETTTGNFTTNGNQGIVVIASEYSGILTSGSLDRTGNNTGNNSSPKVTLSAATRQAKELIIAGFEAVNNVFSLPTNGFSIATQASAGSGLTTGMYSQRVVTATGTYNTQATLAFGERWVSVMASFRVAP